MTRNVHPRERSRAGVRADAARVIPSTSAGDGINLRFTGLLLGPDLAAAEVLQKIA